MTISCKVVGGFIEDKEFPAVAAAREVREELDIHCDVNNLKVH